MRIMVRGKGRECFRTGCFSCRMYRPAAKAAGTRTEVNTKLNPNLKYNFLW